MGSTQTAPAAAPSGEVRPRIVPDGLVAPTLRHEVSGTVETPRPSAGHTGAALSHERSARRVRCARGRRACSDVTLLRHLPRCPTTRSSTRCTEPGSERLRVHLATRRPARIDGSATCADDSRPGQSHPALARAPHDRALRPSRAGVGVRPRASRPHGDSRHEPLPASRLLRAVPRLESRAAGVVEVELRE